MDQEWHPRPASEIQLFFDALKDKYAPKFVRADPKDWKMPHRIEVSDYIPVTKELPNGKVCSNAHADPVTFWGCYHLRGKVTKGSELLGEETECKWCQLSIIVRAEGHEPSWMRNDDDE